jgi:GTP-binding protein
MSGRFRPKLRYAHAGGKNPPSIVIHGNNLKVLPESYKKFLENFYRLQLNLGSTPLVIRFNEGDNPFKERPNLLTERQKKKRKRLVKKRKK